MQGLSWPFVELACDCAEFSLAEARYISAFGEVLSEKAVGICGSRLLWIWLGRMRLQGSGAQIHHVFCGFVGGMRCFLTAWTPFAPRFYGFAQVC
ncbi:hypothetical protein A9Q94_18970 [Rhodobacterales bacterium 56_14_T64]|nr:hypothetical protein A9Q94_18970 [Rhodobacterales bacterium 56_14_T64]